MRECTVNGYRLILDHLSFSSGKPDGTDPASLVAMRLNQAAAPKDRLQVFLSDGSGENASLYGEGDEEEAEDGFYSAPSEDQTDIFRQIRIGDVATFYGKCAQPQKASNPGQFDSRRYYLARRIVLKIGKAELQKLQRPQGSMVSRIVTGYRNLIADLRIGMQRGLLSVFGSEDAPRIAAFVLGDGSGLDSTEKQFFQNGGMSWLVCVSSLHISMLGMAIYGFLRARGLPFVLSAVLAAPAVISYALMTGFSISAQRALVTFLIWMGARITGRTRDTLSSLSAASCVILLRQPLALWDSSFLMSCCCILSLEYVSPAISRIFRPRRAAQKKMCASIGLWIGTLPAVLWFFYQMTPYGSILYPVLLPLMGLFLGFGILGSIGGCLCLTFRMAFFQAGGRAFAWPCHLLIRMLLQICRLESELPYSTLILGRPALWQMMVYYGCLAGFVIWVRRGMPGVYQLPGIFGSSSVGKYLKAAAVLGFLIVMISLRARPDFRYTCLDIGQGSCSLIEHGGMVSLFDAGSSSVKDVWKNRIDSTLKYYGIRKVDTVFLSHSDMDHIDGIEQMLDGYHRNLIGQNAGDVTIRQILIPSLPEQDEKLTRIVQCAKEHGITTGCVREGSCLEQDGLTMKVMGPSPDRITGNANEDCIVMLLIYGKLRMLFTGDLEKEGEEKFVRAYDGSSLFDGGIMILIAGHHGSKNATSSELLDLVRPDLALISCGKNNRYGHPAPAMLERLEEACVPYRRTDLEGALQVCIM